MTVRPALDLRLPEYHNPPIVEVAASIQFASIRGLDTARLGLLWSRFRDTYPQTEQHPPLAAVSETFDSTRGGRVGFSVETSSPVPRIWFLTSDKTRLVQVQSNRLIVNWRQLDTERTYLRFSGLMSMLSDAIERFQKFVEEENLGTITPDQVELTYVNHIRSGDKGSRRDPLSKYLSCWKFESEYWNLGSAEETSFRSQYVLDRPGSASARLFVELDSGYTVSTREPIYVMNLIARGAPDSPDIQSTFKFLEDAHHWIVKGFTSLTTDEAHRLWERQE